MDWSAFENEVFEGVVAALKAASTSYRIYQIGIITDIQSLSTSVSLETYENAASQQTEGTPLNENPAEFLMPDYRRFDTLSLQGKLSIDYSVDNYPYEEERAILVEVTTHLDSVVDRLAETDLLATLNCEPTVWIGVNSNDDWYDHVQKVSTVERRR